MNTETLKEILTAINGYASNPFTKVMALTIADTVKKVIENSWEGKIVNGDFFLKMSNGKFRSMNSLRDID